MELEPGLFAHRDPMPLGPRVSSPDMFSGQIDDLTGLISSADGPLAASSAGVSADVPADVDDAYTATVGVAADAHAAHVAEAAPGVADSLVGNGQYVEDLRQSVLRYMPQPDGDLTITFVEPPDPSVINTGPPTGGGVRVPRDYSAGPPAPETPETPTPVTPTPETPAPTPPPPPAPEPPPPAPTPDQTPPASSGPPSDGGGPETPTV